MKKTPSQHEKPPSIMMDSKALCFTTIDGAHRVICGQSYKGSTIVNYDSRVIICGIFKSGMTLVWKFTIVEPL